MNEDAPTPEPIPQEAAPAAVRLPVGPRLPAWARVLLAMLTMVASMAVVLPVLLLQPLLDQESMVHGALVNLLLAFLSLAFFCGAAWLLTTKIDRRSLTSAGLHLRQFSITALLIGTVTAIAITVPIAVLADALGLAGAISPEESVAGLPTGELAYMIAFALVGAFIAQGIGEEVLFRGYLLSSLRVRAIWAVFIPAAAFGVMHLLSQGGQEDLGDRLLYLVNPFGFAVLAGFLALRLRSVWVAVGIHGGAHVATLMLQLTEIPEPIALQAVVGTAMVVIGLLVWWTAPRETRQRDPRQTYIGD